MDRETCLAVLKRHNRETFHLRHALTVEAAMRRFAESEGYADEIDFWGLVGLLHDLDFEECPEQHCLAEQGWLREAGFDERFVRAVASHGWGLIEGLPRPEHPMEKILFACDELTGLIGACALVRPSHSIQDMDLKSLKKKFKAKEFAAGCSREVIERGAEICGWTLEELLEKTLEAMKKDEAAVAEALA